MEKQCSSRAQPADKNKISPVKRKIEQNVETQPPSPQINRIQHDLSLNRDMFRDFVFQFRRICRRRVF